MSSFLTATWQRWVLASILVGICLWSGLAQARLYDAQKQMQFGNSNCMDSDTCDFTAVVESHPRFRDTLEWWHGPWYPKVPYFRPATMTLFWVEHRVFGAQARVPLTWIHRGCHVGFTLLVLGFFVSAAGWKRGTLATGLFALGTLEWLQLPSGNDAFNCWKDQCDIITASVFVGAAWCFWRYLATGEKRKWWAAFVIWVVGLTFKESALTVPFMVTGLVFLVDKSKWRAALPFWGGAAFYWAYRTWALKGPGHRTGTNGAWLRRVGRDALGIPSDLVNGDTLPLFLLCVLVSVFLLLKWRDAPRDRRTPRLFAVWVGVGALGWWFSLRFFGGSALDNIERAMMIIPWQSAGRLAGVLIFYWLVARFFDPPTRFALLWMGVTFIPIAFQPPTSPHVYYMLAPGWCLILVCAFWHCRAIAPSVWQRWK